MSPHEAPPSPLSDPSVAGRRLDRRRFLTGLSLLAGFGVLAPLLSRARGAALASVEAGRPLLGTWVRVVARHPDRACAAPTAPSRGSIAPRGARPLACPPRCSRSSRRPAPARGARAASTTRPC